MLGGEILTLPNRQEKLFKAFKMENDMIIFVL